MIYPYAHPCRFIGFTNTAITSLPPPNNHPMTMMHDPDRYH